MTRTTTVSELRWLSSVTAAMYGATTLRELAEGASVLLHNRFRAQQAACEELRYDGSSYLLRWGRFSVPPPADLAAHIHDHPVMPVIASGRLPPTWRLTDAASPSTWHRTDHYNGIARPMCWSEQYILFAAPVGEAAFGSLSLYRDRAFNPAEQGSLRLIQPHFQAVWSRLRVRESSPPDATRSSVLALEQDLRPVPTSEQEALLRRYFPDWSTRTPSAAVRTWLDECRARVRAMPAAEPLRPLVRSAPFGRLVLRYFPGRETGGSTIRLTDQPVGLPVARLRERSLTARECEVLQWIAHGKRDSEIAAILGCASATVSKHVERILLKLAAPNRLAAVAEAMDARSTSFGKRPGFRDDDGHAS